MASRKVPVQDFFRVTTPSMSVTIRADDTPLPSNVQPQRGPANLVTVSALESRASRAPVSGGAEVTSDPHPANEPYMPTSQEQATSDVDSLITSSETLLKGSNIRRFESKHAEALYSRPGAPPPVQNVEPISTPVSEGLIKQLSTYETRDFTYWDKLRRRGTETEIRRWRTYLPEDVQDTPFFGRNILVDVPGEAYNDHTYFSEIKGNRSQKEFKLETIGYVAPARYVRSAPKRLGDPVQKLYTNVMNAALCVADSTCY